MGMSILLGKRINEMGFFDFFVVVFFFSKYDSLGFSYVSSFQYFLVGVYLSLILFSFIN
jgi:hypothetical protein